MLPRKLKANINMSHNILNNKIWFEKILIQLDDFKYNAKLSNIIISLIMSITLQLN